MSTSIAIIGGSGFYAAESLNIIAEHYPDTPFGKPSAPIIEAEADGSRVLFLARHGLGHCLLPHEVPFRANIYALKALGVVGCLAVNAAGSLIEEYAPGSLVIPDQIIDFTHRRQSTFFGQGVVGHCSMAEPFAEPLIATLGQRLAMTNKTHLGGTYVCIEGPQFSSRAESRMYQGWGGQLIGMTLATEAKLCREAELPLVSICMITDYDCWRPNTSSVETASLLDLLNSMVISLKNDLPAIIEAMLSGVAKVNPHVLENSLVTSVEQLRIKQDFPARGLFKRLIDPQAQ